MSRRSLAVVVAVLVVAAGASAWWIAERRAAAIEDAARDVAASYLAAWEGERWGELDALAGGPGAEAGAVHEQAHDGMGVADGTYELADVTFDDPGPDQATARYEADLELARFGSLRYEGELVLARVDDEWLVDWSPSTVHPELEAGGRVTTTREWPDRAPLLGPDGAPLSAPADIVVVGVVPGRVEDEGELADRVAETTPADAPDVEAVLDRPDLESDWFYPLASLPRDDYDEVRDELHPVPGLAFREERVRAPVSSELAGVVGEVGEATAEQLEELGEPYAAGDVVGQTGLERVLERRLAGTPGGEVQVVDADGDAVAVLARLEPEEPQAATISVDAAAQRAAMSALASRDEPSALVAVDVPSGEVRAAASRPEGGFQRALSGRYPPGSTFKVVTATALLEAGTAPETPASCPATATIGGRAFRNAGGSELGAIDFREAFAESCNTAFVQLASDLPSAALRDAAELFGFNAAYGTGFAETPGSFPEPEDAVEQAAAAIGQGRVTATPLHMAGVAAAVARGSWQPPTLVLDDDDAVEDAEARALPAGTTEQLAAMMREVVESGTGTAAAAAAGVVHGKTGTAEFGSGDPPPAHAWFIGFRDDLAFAVVVEGGESGAQVAAPVVADFLDRLDGAG